jgi:hypothetical protein
MVQPCLPFIPTFHLTLLAFSANVSITASKSYSPTLVQNDNSETDMHRRAPKWGLSNLTDEAFLAKFNDTTNRNINTIGKDKCPNARISSPARAKYNAIGDATVANLYQRDLQFFDLPRELRDEIYHHALEGVSISFPFCNILLLELDHLTDYIPFIVAYGERDRMDQRVFPAWLRYNNRLRREGLTQFYRHAKLIINVPFNTFTLTSMLLGRELWSPDGSLVWSVQSSHAVPDIRNVGRIAIRAWTATEGSARQTIDGVKRCVVCGMAPTLGNLSQTLRVLNRLPCRVRELELFVDSSVGASVPRRLRREFRHDYEFGCHWCNAFRRLPSNLERLRIDTGIQRCDESLEHDCMPVESTLADVVRKALLGPVEEVDVKVSKDRWGHYDQYTRNGSWWCEGRSALYKRKQRARQMRI